MNGDGDKPIRQAEDVAARFRAGLLDWRHLSGLAKREAGKLLGDEEAARDTSQDTMVVLRILEKAGHVPVNPEAWVTKVAQNRAKNELRRRTSQAVGLARLESRSSERGREDFADRIVARIVVEELLAALSERQRAEPVKHFETKSQGSF